MSSSSFSNYEKLEENVLAQRSASGVSSSADDTEESDGLASRVRDIITRNLSDTLEELDFSPPSMSSTTRAYTSLQDENSILEKEVARLEELLSMSRTERDDLSGKYTALTEKTAAETRCGRPRHAGLHRRRRRGASLRHPRVADERRRAPESSPTDIDLDLYRDLDLEFDLESSEATSSSWFIVIVCHSFIWVIIIPK
ncbi:PREDICTED: uncharacterized protein LOC106810087 [Priapulus caudatus]|uniref:Uncharacterized protein LOC106810087 n=1 Tax=Priapulus caudatus TaxID=37621 RepID=A0ABM1E9H6_PRICU|nr:PREDICTED: uncharacterized protein LOC106810087 [Priapulus caudatus]